MQELPTPGECILLTTFLYKVGLYSKPMSVYTSPLA